MREERVMTKRITSSMADRTLAAVKQQWANWLDVEKESNGPKLIKD
jgi:hypothetical protein